ncbi:MAG: cytochrome c biogenesis protein CcsA [Bacteroidota bacterium]
MSNLGLHESLVLTALLVFLPAFVYSLVQNKSTKSFRWSEILNGLAVLTMACIIIFLWIHFERPPMRSIGETRLWYAFFMPLVGGITYRLWKYRWFLSYSLLMGMVFLFINLLKPEIFVKHLPPALQSAWFVPHVVVYILGYSLLAASAIVSLYYLLKPGKNISLQISDRAEKLVYSGFTMISLGLIFGALWAKVAWGNYWSWDPKETWALITWLVYLIYIHYRLRSGDKAHDRKAMLYLVFAFLIMLLAWMGMKFIPAAQSSVHLYG